MSGQCEPYPNLEPSAPRSRTSCGPVLCSPNVTPGTAGVDTPVADAAASVAGISATASSKAVGNPASAAWVYWFRTSRSAVRHVLSRSAVNHMPRSRPVNLP